MSYDIFIRPLQGELFFKSGSGSDENKLIYQYTSNKELLLSYSSSVGISNLFHFSSSALKSFQDFNFDSTSVGITYGGVATNATFLRGNGTRFVPSTILATDVPSADLVLGTNTNGFTWTGVNTNRLLGTGNLSINIPQRIDSGASPTYVQLTLSNAGTGTSNAVRADRTLQFNSGVGITSSQTSAQNLTANRSWTFDLNGQVLALHNATSSNGLFYRNGTTIGQRSIAGISDRTTITNGDGASGNPTVDIASTYVGQNSITTLGTITTGIWNGTVIGTLYGGTGQSTYTDGQLLIGNTAGNLTKATLTGTTNRVIVTNGNGSITLSVPQDIHTTASPTFNQLTLNNAGTGTSNAVRADRTLTFSNGTGINSSQTGAQNLTANRTWSFNLTGQALTLHNATSSNGLFYRNGSTIGQRTIVGVSNRTTITNGDGASGNPTVDIASTYVGQNSITTLGTITTGTWNANTISVPYGGTGTTTFTQDRILVGNGTNPIYSPNRISWNPTNRIFRTDGTIQTSTDVITDGYNSGFFGGGYRFWKDGGVTFGEIDNLIIRSTLRTHIFQKDVVRATNGYLLISDVSSISQESTGSVIYLKEDVFRQGDLLWYKDANPQNSGGDIISEVKLVVNSTGSTVTNGEDQEVTAYDVTVISGQTSNLKIGGTLVRVGSSEKGRQGSVYFDASSPNAPYMDIYDGVDSFTTFQTQDKLKGRFGNLSSIYDNTFGKLKSFGVYTKNIYATGNAQIAGSLTVGDSRGFGTSFYAGRINRNLLKSSANIGDIYWQKTANVSVQLTASLAPDDTMTATRLHFSANESNFVYQVIATEPNESHVFSVFAKLSSGSIQDLTDDSFVFETDEEIDLSFQLTNDWKRYDMKGISNANGTIVVYLRGSNPNIKIDVWGAQLEIGENIGAYQPTTENNFTTKRRFGWYGGREFQSIGNTATTYWNTIIELWFPNWDNGSFTKTNYITALNSYLNATTKEVIVQLPYWDVTGNFNPENNVTSWWTDIVNAVDDHPRVVGYKIFDEIELWGTPFIPFSIPELSHSTALANYNTVKSASNKDVYGVFHEANLFSQKYGGREPIVDVLMFDEYRFYTQTQLDTMKVSVPMFDYTVGSEQEKVIIRQLIGRWKPVLEANGYRRYMYVGQGIGLHTDPSNTHPYTGYRNMTPDDFALVKQILYEIYPDAEGYMLWDWTYANDTMKVNGNTALIDWYQKPEFGSWTIKGGFGGTIQNPIVKATNFGIEINRNDEYTSQTLTNNSIMIGNVQGQARRAIKIANVSSSNASGLFGYTSNGTESFALRLDGTANIAGWGFDDNKLSKGNVEINSTNQSIRLGTFTSITNMNGVFMSGSGIMRVGNTTGNNLYWNGTNLILTGSIVASGGTIGGWNISANSLTNSPISLNATDQRISVAPSGFAPPTNVVILGKNLSDPNKYGLYIYNSSNDLVFKSDDDGTSISGFNITNGVISSTNNNLILRSNGEITGSAVQFTGGRIGGWNLSATSISNGNVEINSTNQSIRLGTFTSITNMNGVFMSGSGIMRVGNTSGNNLYWNGTNLILTGSIVASGGTIGGWNISTNSLTNSPISLNATDQRISVAPSGFAPPTNVVILGKSLSDANKYGLYIYNSSNDLVFKSDDDGTTISGFNITNGVISSTNNNLILRSNGQITGSAVQFTGGTIGGWNLSSTNISNGNVEINSSNQSIRLGTFTSITNMNGVFMSGSGIMRVGNTAGNNLYWNGTNLILTGSIVASGGTIGGWGINSNELFKAPLYLDAQNERIYVAPFGTSSQDNNIVIGQSLTSQDEYGFYVYDDSGNEIVSLDTVGASIAGWGLVTNKLTKKGNDGVEVITLSPVEITSPQQTPTNLLFYVMTQTSMSYGNLTDTTYQYLTTEDANNFPNVITGGEDGLTDGYEDSDTSFSVNSSTVMEADDLENFGDLNFVFKITALTGGIATTDWVGVFIKIEFKRGSSWFPLDRTFFSIQKDGTFNLSDVLVDYADSEEGLIYYFEKNFNLSVGVSQNMSSIYFSKIKTPIDATAIRISFRKPTSGEASTIIGSPFANYNINIHQSPAYSGYNYLVNYNTIIDPVKIESLIVKARSNFQVDINTYPRSENSVKVGQSYIDSNGFLKFRTS
jgi:hypothetical protein